jgi:hypothetical protein
MAKRKKKDKAGEVDEVMGSVKNAVWCKKEACTRYMMLHSSCPKKSCFYSKE